MLGRIGARLSRLIDGWWVGRRIAGEGKIKGRLGHATLLHWR